MIIEIEDVKGSTLCAFRVKNAKEKDLELFHNCNLADVESDYLLNTEDTLMRVQLTKEFPK